MTADVHETVDANHASAPVQTTSMWQIALVAVLIVLLGGGVAAYLLWPERQIAVPRVTGIPFDDARNMLADRGLGAIKIEVPDDSVAEGIVVGQEPDEPAQMDKYKAVRLKVATARDAASPSRDGVSTNVKTPTAAESSSLVSVPRVVGLPFDQAQQQLQQRGLRGIRSEMVNDGTPLNVVMQQTPDASEQVEAGAAIVLYVAIH